MPDEVNQFRDHVADALAQLYFFRPRVDDLSHTFLTPGVLRLVVLADFLFKMGTSRRSHYRCVESLRSHTNLCQDVLCLLLLRCEFGSEGFHGVTANREKVLQRSLNTGKLFFPVGFRCLFTQVDLR